MGRHPPWDFPRIFCWGTSNSFNPAPPLLFGLNIIRLNRCRHPQHDVFIRRAPGDVGEKVLGAYIKAIYQMFRLSGMDPGLEFKVALEEADRIGARVVLGDRSQGHTIQRLRAAITMADVMKYVMSGGRNPSEWLERDLVHKLESIDWNNPESVVELIKTRRAVRALTSYVRREFPRVATAMVDERDEIMTKGLLNQCGGRTVAVVGMAHMDGIEARWWQAQGGDSAVSLISGS